MPEAVAAISMVQAAMAIRANCNRIVTLVRAALGQGPNMVNFKIGSSIGPDEWCR
ncbi:hypothetical protein SFHH103_00245 [Sinorhizobium fredii HH103]|uniref:Uncharacterized protein n=1 Tax=Sinorhizobium fredii (strain HH103) TaxID=1117943 RepID=G9AAW9_SINF1|nr:hypothetical protein SFHH103_00245 [Sinorhizobium fredii HH103]